MSKLQGNRGAFLDMIAFSEGTARVPDSDDGYRVSVGGGTFDGYADHPRKLIDLEEMAHDEWLIGLGDQHDDMVDFYRCVGID